MTEKSEQHAVDTLAITPERYAAVHRALLSGLLPNVGFKKEVFEYLGTRGRTFHIFPGSGLFSRKPPWLMAAELTQTTKLYARTVARIDPAWIERVGEHLLHREYSEPYYHRDTAHVMAFEKVSLQGLVVVPRRRVHYGPIDPKTSRTLFIRQGLVEGEYVSDAPWARHNRTLIREIELAEAKLRRRDLLVDADTRHAFFDGRLPAGIYNGPLFEKWRHAAELKDRRILFMRRDELIVPGPDAPAAMFPDHVVVNETTRITISYTFDPGNPADGVTATVPLALLGQLPPEPFQWLVPGHLLEKVTELIRGLPKDLRVQFVPVPDTARSVSPMLAFGEGSLTAALAWQLGKRIGQSIPAAAFLPDEVPDWLRMNFRVVDDAGRPLASGRDLKALRRQLGAELKETFEQLPSGQWHRDGITRWDFDDLPQHVEVKRPGITVKAFPAIVDRGNGVSLRLLDTARHAADATRAGLRRLFLLQLGADQVKHLQKRLPHIDRMCVLYATIGTCDELRRDLLIVAADRALFGDAGPGSNVGGSGNAGGSIIAGAGGSTDLALLRRRETFVSRAEAAWQSLAATTRQTCDVALETLELYQSLATRLAQPTPSPAAPGVADLRSQISALMPKGFLASTPWPWLRHFPRYLRAADQRLRKLLEGGIARDAQWTAQVQPLWKQYLARKELHAFQGVEDPNLQTFRWWIEELRVSLFAQELKTSVPVSVKRLEQLLSEIR